MLFKFLSFLLDSKNSAKLKFKIEEIHHYRIRLLQQVYALKFNVTQDQIDQQVKII